MPRHAKDVSASRIEAKLYQGKAVQFLATAQAALREGRHDAAMLSAIHAAISATDAVTTALAGRRSADPDHQRAVDLLEEVASGSEEIRTRARQLRQLLTEKNAVEYQSRMATEREASDAVTRAERFVKWAIETVKRAKV